MPEHEARPATSSFVRPTLVRAEASATMWFALLPRWRSSPATVGFSMCQQASSACRTPDFTASR